MRTKIRTSDTLPPELARSAPRPITLTASGIAVAVCIGALVVGAIVAGVLLEGRLSRDADPVAATEARIIRLRPSDERVAVVYAYSVDGHEYGGTTRVRKRDVGRFKVESTVPVRYVAARPQESWLQGYGSRPLPYWLIVAVPGVLLLGTVPLTILIRRQATLLREGRAALARITTTKKRNLGEHTAWRVEYEWKMLSGAVRSGRHDISKGPPPVGALIPIVYDRENPKRQAPYPFSLVRLLTLTGKHRTQRQVYQHHGYRECR